MSKWMPESDVEELFLDILSELGYSIEFGPDISPGGKKQEREYSDPVLNDRLKERLHLINPEIPNEAIEEAIRILRKNNSQDLVSNNHDFHSEYLSLGDVIVPYRESMPSLTMHNSLNLNIEGISLRYVWICLNADHMVAFSSSGFLSSIRTKGMPFIKRTISGLLSCLFSMMVNWLTARNSLFSMLLKSNMKTLSCLIDPFLFLY